MLLKLLEMVNILLSLYMLYYVIIGVFAFRKKHKTKPSTPKNKFAVLIPARNEENTIANLIQSLQQQSYPKDLYDIIVIPNNCKDNTRKMC